MYGGLIEAPVFLRYIQGFVISGVRYNRVLLYIQRPPNRCCSHLQQRNSHEIVGYLSEYLVDKMRILETTYISNYINFQGQWEFE